MRKRPEPPVLTARRALAIVAAATIVSSACAWLAPPAQAPMAAAETSPVATATATATVVAEARPTPTPTPIAAAVPTAPPPAVMPTSDLDEPLIRVLLKRSSTPLHLPQPGRVYRLTWQDHGRWLWGPIAVESTSSRAWQVGAFSDENTTVEVIARLEAVFGDAVMISSEATDSGLRRVRLRWLADQPDDPAARLEELGWPGAFAVVEGGALRLRDATGAELELPATALLEPAGEWSTAFAGRRYRGRFLLRAVGEQVLLINELNLESYLAGVVPVEMGPYEFPELEALKAQAVAARTYAVAHLGDHDDEGYDICSTPACQAYHGAGAEHRLSSRAVEETAGLVATWQGQPIDAMYTSTCGGHTEDAAVIFADRAQPYLRGVACAWERELELVGSGGSGGWMDSGVFESDLARRALAVQEVKVQPQMLVQAVGAACAGAREVAVVETTASGYAEALLAAAGLQSAGAVHGGRKEPLQQLLGLTDLVDVPLPPPGSDWQSGWHLRAALAVLEVQGVVARDRGEAVPHAQGVAIYPKRAERSQPLPSPVHLYERWADRYRPLDRAAVYPGETLERVRRGDEVLALVVKRSGGGGAADRRSAWRSWVRERSWSVLAERLGVADLQNLEITHRSKSGRVVGLAAVGRGGERREWIGFGVRRALDLPENLFTFHRLRRGDEVVVRFIGRGWGHGVGLCQNGAYGLARAGRRFEEILGTYYQGVVVEQWSGDRGEP